MTGPGTHAAIVIIGSGDHARVVADVLRAQGARAIGHVEPLAPMQSSATRSRTALPVIGSLDDADGWRQPGLAFVVALGDNAARRDAYNRCLTLGLSPVAAVHPSAVLLGGSVVGAGAVVCAGTVIGVGAEIGINAIVNTAASVDHDNRIGPHTTVGPGARLAGRVELGEGAFVGIGASVRQGIRIGAWALVAGGAMVIRDVPVAARVAGIPAVPMAPSDGERFAGERSDDE